MDKELALKILQLSIEGQRLENEKWNIRIGLKEPHGGTIPTWEEVAVSAITIIMEEKNNVKQ